jgi:hypothetical protein
MGGFGFGDAPGPAPGQKHRDAPLTHKGKVIWRLILAAIILATIVLVVASLDS